MDEEKILDLLIDIVDKLSLYTPSTPPNPFLGQIRVDVAQLKLLRTRTKTRFKLHFDDLANLTKKISDIKFQ